MKATGPTQGGGFDLEVEHAPPTGQQLEQMREGLRILAAWFIRRRRRELAAGQDGGQQKPENPLTGRPP